MNAFNSTGASKDQLVTSLAALLLTENKAEITAESIEAVLSSSGNKVPSYYPTLFASFVNKAGGCDKFCMAPGGGGGGGGAAPAAAAGGAAPAAAKAPEKPKEEEVDPMEGGMDMFGGGGGGKDY